MAHDRELAEAIPNAEFLHSVLKSDRATEHVSKRIQNFFNVDVHTVHLPTLFHEFTSNKS